MVDHLDAGGNYLDTANVYGGGTRGSHERDAGTSERTVGALVAGRRHRFVIGTKGAGTMTDQVRPNGFGLSRIYLTRAIDASLRELDRVSRLPAPYPMNFWTPSATGKTSSTAACAEADSCYYCSCRRLAAVYPRAVVAMPERNSCPIPPGVVRHSRP